MKVYFLVEGRRTESKVYVSWLSHLLPELVRIEFPDDALPNCYFLISAEGYPSIVNDFIPASIQDINNIGGFDYLVICLDSDEDTVQERVNEIEQFIEDKNLHLRESSLFVVVQNRCIETWFLGNRRMVVRNPTSTKLREYLAYYDVRTDDPELMPPHVEFSTHAQFHLEYVKEIFRERGMAYTKKRPGHVLDKPFLEQLIARTDDDPTHLSSFQVFLGFCERVKQDIQHRV